jgi:hypothetical protein
MHGVHVSDIPLYNEYVAALCLIFNGAVTLHCIVSDIPLLRIVNECTSVILYLIFERVAHC